MASMLRDLPTWLGRLSRRASRAAGLGLGILFAQPLSLAAQAAAFEGGALVAAASTLSAQPLALADRLIFGGVLLILFAILATVAATMWRDLVHRSRRP